MPVVRDFASSQVLALETQLCHRQCAVYVHAALGLFMPNADSGFVSKLCVSAEFVQVAAFGPAAARSLLFLGHIQSVSVSTWPADSPAAVKLWQASLSTAQTASGSLRVGRWLSWSDCLHW